MYIGEEPIFLLVVFVKNNIIQTTMFRTSPNIKEAKDFAKKEMKMMGYDSFYCIDTNLSMENVIRLKKMGV
jgi:hypothetical protein